MRNIRIEYPDFATISVVEQIADLLAEIGSTVHHRQQNPLDFQLRIDLSAHLGNRLK